MHNLWKPLATGILALGAISAAEPAAAFCGFFVAKGDAKLFNEASKVVMVRDQDRTVITMVNDFQGEVKDFAMVIPAPTVLKREQIHVTENAIVDHLDAYTAPRLVEYHHADPCRRFEYERTLSLSGTQAPVAAQTGAIRRKSLGVKIEAEYTVGEYDILILSAKESDGLATWLTENDYRIPDGAAPVLGSYIKQGMKFFVAKVNLEEHAKSGNTFLRPLQIAFESEKFMLPIRLGTLNAKGKQDLLLWTLTRKGRVETANYRTVRMPTGNEIPTYVKEDFGPTYKAIYGEAVNREGGAAVMLEYAWDMGWCDPCAADPLSARELRELGVFWIKPQPENANQRVAPQAQDVSVTRLHARYDAESFPEDLRLIETGDRQNFQGRYVMRHPWKGDSQCPAAEKYRASLPERFETEAQTLARLTGWSLSEIRIAMRDAGAEPSGDDVGDWWKDLWKD
ncbi:MAG: DUF2330 domain-containing protein [Pseudomonadota bacterium]